MSRLRLALFASLIFTFSTTAYADWQFTHWGQMPDDVISTIKQSNMQHVDNFIEPIIIYDSTQKIKIYDYKVGSAYYNVNFFFSNQNKGLSVVALCLSKKTNIYEYQSSNMHDDLYKFLGIPDTFDNARGVDRMTWRDLGRNNLIYAQVPKMISPEEAARACVIYRPISGGGDGGF